MFDDVALPRYMNNPRVHFVPGHLVLQNATPELMKGLGVHYPSKVAMRWGQFQRWGIRLLVYGNTRQVTALGAGIAAARFGAKRLRGSR